MRKKILLAVVLVLVAVLTLSLAACGASDKLKNAGFEDPMNDDNTFSGWTEHKEEGATGIVIQHTAVPDGSNEQTQWGSVLGSRYLNVKIPTSNSKGSYAYLAQPVKLTKNVVYELTAYIKVNGNITGASSTSDKQAGARVGFLEDKDFAKIKVVSSNGGWTKYSVYITPATSKTLTLVVGIGDTAVADDGMGKSRGEAWFDAISLTRVDKSAVGDIAASDIYTVKSGSSYDYNDGGSVTFTVLLTIFSLFLCVAAYFLIRKVFAGKKGDPEVQAPAPVKGGDGVSGGGAAAGRASAKQIFTSPIAVFVYILLAAFVVRLILVLTVPWGEVSGLERLRDAAVSLAQYNPTNYFTNNSASTIPYGMLYILWALGGFADLAGIASTSSGMFILMKLPMIIADIVSCYMIYMLASKYYNGKIAAIFAGLWALLPIVFTASSVWGMTTVVAIPFLIGAFSSMLGKKYISASVLYTLALMFDYYVIFLAPLFIAFFIYNFVRNADKKDRIKIGAVNLSCLIGFFVLALPFTVFQTGQGRVFYIVEQMWSFFAGVDTLNVDIFNLYTMIGLANAELPFAMHVLEIIFAVIVCFGIMCLYFKTRNRLNIILLASFIFIFIAVIGAKAQLPLMILGIACLFVYTLISGERRAFGILTGYSALTFLNMALILGQSGFITNNPNSTYIGFEKVSAAGIIFSLITIVLTVYYAYVMTRITFFEEEKDILPMRGTLKEELINTKQSMAFKARILFSKDKD